MSPAVHAVLYLSPGVFVCVSVCMYVMARVALWMVCAPVLLTPAPFSRLLHASLGSVLIGPVSLCFQSSILVV